MFKEIGEETLITLIFLGTIILIVFVSFVVFLSFLFTTKKNKLIQRQTLLQSQFQQTLLQTQLEIQEQTLKTIAQEIHDNIGQVLSLAKLNLNTFPAATEPTIQTKIDDTKMLVSKAITDLRDLSRSMHGDKIKELGLEAAVANELKIIQNTGQFTTSLLITGEQTRLEPQKETVLFRIVQEALHNAVKHSNAQNIDVQISYAVAVFSLSVTDNGVGFDITALHATQTGIGLKSMKNRAGLIGGEFLVYSDTESGTSITIEIKNIRP